MYVLRAIAEVIANLNVLRDEMTALLERLANAVQVDSSREKERKRQVRQLLIMCISCTM